MLRLSSDRKEKRDMGKAITKEKTNQQLVQEWLDKDKRDWAYLAEISGIFHSTLSLFKKGKKTAPTVIVRIAEITGLPLKIQFKGSKTVITLNEVNK